MSKSKKHEYVYNIMKTANTPNEILKVSTFEIRNEIKTMWIDRKSGTYTTHRGDKILSRLKKSFALNDFLKTSNCRTVHYYSNGEYKYTCKYYSPYEKNITLKRSY